MPRLKAANFARTVLPEAIDALATAFDVADASLFPDPPFGVVVDAEVMEVTAIDRPNNRFTGVQRGREGTTPAAHDANAVVQNRLTAGMYNSLLDDGHLAAPDAPHTGHETPSGAQGKVNTHAALATGVHGVGSANVVGTTATQTLTNKTLGSGTKLGATCDAQGNNIDNLGRVHLNQHASGRLVLPVGTDKWAT